jgi:sigma-E factor negative regulatory protein RseA
MTENRLEQVSAFMDGELEAQATKPVVDRVISEGDLRQCWQRYHLIGDVMRNTLPGRSTVSIASRVSQALKNEPTILSPEPIVDKSAADAKAHRHPIGYAVAASVAVVGFLTVGLVSRQVEQPAGPDVAVATAPVMDVNSPVVTASVLPAATTQVSPSVVTVASSDSQPLAEEQVSPKLQEWVLNHEFSSFSASRHGVPPNVRLVTFTGAAQGSR